MLTLTQTQKIEERPNSAAFSSLSLAFLNLTAVCSALFCALYSVLLYSNLITTAPLSAAGVQRGIEGGGGGGRWTPQCILLNDSSRLPTI